MWTLGVVNSKGGVGKSTIAVHLAAWIHDGGAKVAMVDADGQRSSTSWLRKAYPNDEIPCFRWEKSAEIRKKLPKLKGSYDVVIIDGPGNAGSATETIMELADGIFVPCGPSVLDLEAMIADALRLARDVQKRRGGGWPLVRIIPNKLQRRYRLSKEMLEAVEGLDVLTSTGLSLRSAYADAPGQGTVVWKMGSSAKAAADEINLLFNEILTTASTLDGETIQEEPETYNEETADDRSAARAFA